MTLTVLNVLIFFSQKYAQQQIANMPRPVTIHARSKEQKPVTVIEMKKIPWFDFSNWYSPKTKIRVALVKEKNFSDSSISTNNV